MFERECGECLSTPLWLTSVCAPARALCACKSVFTSIYACMCECWCRGRWSSGWKEAGRWGRLWESPGFARRLMPTIFHVINSGQHKVLESIIQLNLN